MKLYLTKTGQVMLLLRPRDHQKCGRTQKADNLTRLLPTMMVNGAVFDLDHQPRICLLHQRIGSRRLGNCDPARPSFTSQGADNAIRC